MPVLIEVTAEDIAEGVPKDDCECPVARAIKRATGLRTSVAELGISVNCYYPDSVEVRTPDEVREFVTRFDAGSGVEPFSFLLDYSPAPVSDG